MAQLREANSITETTFTKFARQIQAWLDRALKSLRLVAISIDSEGGALDGFDFLHPLISLYFNDLLLAQNKRKTGFKRASDVWVVFFEISRAIVVTEPHDTAALRVRVRISAL